MEGHHMQRKRLLLAATVVVGSLVGIGTCISNLLYDVAPLLL